jgi:hypothetical protein
LAACGGCRQPHAMICVQLAQCGFVCSSAAGQRYFITIGRGAWRSVAVSADGRIRIGGLIRYISFCRRARGSCGGDDDAYESRQASFVSAKIRLCRVGPCSRGTTWRDACATRVCLRIEEKLRRSSMRSALASRRSICLLKRALEELPHAGFS